MKNNLIKELEGRFEELSDPDRAVQMSAYMKNHFPFYGIQAELRTRTVKECMTLNRPASTEELIALLKEMWGREEREWHYAAIILLSANKKLWTGELAECIEYMIIHKSWWDSVDGISGTCVSDYFRKFPDIRYGLLHKWEASGNMWLIRVCIIHQLKYGAQTDLQYLEKIIRQNCDSNEFFIRKAIGWALRQYAKINPGWVKNFAENTDLKPLSRREALKNII